MMASVASPSSFKSTISTYNLPITRRGRTLTLVNFLNPSNTFNSVLTSTRTCHSSPISCTKLSPWKPQTSSANNMFEKAEDGVIETLTSLDEKKDETLATTSIEYFMKWPMWLLGPLVLLATGVAPTLWLPLSTISVGPNAASLLALTGLDCVFNLGATLFLLMADFCAVSAQPRRSSEPPLSYKFWNVLAAVGGFLIPLGAVLASWKGTSLLQPQQGFMVSAVLLGPYLLLLSVQTLTEVLTWHWRSPVWLVTPVVYEAYRLLQLMRGLKLGAELGAPAWAMHGLRGLVSWWVLVLGMQLMRVAWFAGFAARADGRGSRQDQPASSAEDW